ncbi:MAG TPA: prepilin-type N-terminal cleavage/methylation domain-containing protein [Anaeromyxobacteraceae bacterium]|nr:prepilin-type N-terminal cleavage/methylation domain-containing protein [Anaeromyxobacteraceae bacterium]
MTNRASHAPRVRSSARRAGFTLLEVMVALGLLASALMALAELSGQALRNHAYARDLSAATLLARGKMVELEQKYEDQGFRDFDERDEGDFADQGRPGFKWQVDLKKPQTELSADGILAALTGSGDATDAMSKLLGSATVPGSGGSATVQSPIAGLATGLLQTQVTAFGETLKKSLREMRLTVSWRDGKVPREISVSTYLVVLNPRAPGGARGDNPDVPPNLAAPVAGGVAAAGAAGTAGVPNIPGVTGGMPGVTGGIPGLTTGVPGMAPGLSAPGTRPGGLPASTPFRRSRRNRTSGE